MTTNPSNLGFKVTSRDYSWLDMCTRAWGSEFNAPDHGAYSFSGGRQFDSTDRGRTGIYGVTVYEALGWDNNYPDMLPTFAMSDTGEEIGMG